MTLEGQRFAQQVGQCVEPGCDRAAAEGDERCELHQSRLGARPSRPSRPSGPSAPPRPAPLPVIVEDALDASAAVPPDRVSNRRFWLGLGGWALGACAFFSLPAVGEPVLRWAVNWGLDRGAALAAFAAVWLVFGGFATYGAGRSFFATASRGRSLLALVLGAVTGIPAILFLYLFGQKLFSMIVGG